MSDKMEVYYFSPTGGTKKVSDIFAAAVGKEAVWHDLGDKQTPTEQPQGELIIVAAPVFAGRIPSVVREKIKTLAGEGKQAVTIAVYGNRAYEDALLEMNDILIQGGFTVISICCLCGAAFYRTGGRRRQTGCGGYKRDTYICRGRQEQYFRRKYSCTRQSPV